MIDVKCTLCIFLYFICVQGNPIELLSDLKNGDLNLNLLLNNLKNVEIETLLNQAESSFQERKLHPDLGKNVKQLIRKNKYPIETHVITTSDGYILETHRIPHGRNNSGEQNKPAVLVMPGLLCSSADWIISGPERGLGYILADAGYDVWLGNPRGTTWSRKHVSLKPKYDEKFWDFSYHEMGIFDLPATIDYILNKTGEEKLFYIAHSQGSASFFVLASELPEYNEKIRLMFALAPSSYNNNMKSPLLRAGSFYLEQIQQFTKESNMTNIFAHTTATTMMGQLLCSDGAPTQDLCALMLFAIVGFDEPQLNKTNLPVLFSNFPAGASVKQFWHFAQGVLAGEFRNYDYGAVDNLKKYNQEVPPDYDLKKITSPVATFYSKNDWISTEVDARRLMNELPNLVLDHLVEYEKFNHMDFIWAIDAPTLVYDYILKLMKEY